MEILQVSGLSQTDYVLLVGHYARITQGSQINPDIYDRGYSPEQIKALEDQYKERSKSNTIKMLNLEFNGILDNYEYPNFDYVMTLFVAYDKHGILPFPGSLSDQPAQIIDIFNVLGQIQFETEMKIQKDHERDLKRIQSRRPNGRR